jgi:diguanylate cyclase (GGDEF)-like protein
MTQKISLSFSVLDRLMPMHIIVDAEGRITHAGPTAARLRPDDDLDGKVLLELFDCLRPSGTASMDALRALAGQRLHLQFSAPPHTRLRGLVQPLEKGGILLNLSLGYSVVEAVGDYALTSLDFSHCDPTVEMLFLIEAKSAALSESKKLNARLNEAREAAQSQAETDSLTGLPNRRAIDKCLLQMTNRRRHTDFGLMHLDLDYFKQVNDTYGHAAGDHVLLEVADILREETRGGDLVARVGGDEFVLIFPDCTDVDLLNNIAARIINRLELPIPFGAVECRISASIGTTISSLYSHPNPDRMLSDADTALYESKNAGRACHTFFEGEAEPDISAAH